MTSFLMTLFSSILTIVAAHDGSAIVTFLGQECDGAITPQVYVKGGQPGNKIKDVDECVSLCETSNDCESITFYHREEWTDANGKTHEEQKYCKHFYTACGSLKASPGATTVTHLANMDSYWSLAPIGYGRKCEGTPLASSGKQESVAKCTTACDSESACQSVTFTFADKTCEHFSTKCENSPTDQNNRQAGIVSMVRRAEPLQSKCDEGKGNDGSPREKWLKAFRVSDLAACEKSCEDETKCQSITFRKDWTNNCNHFETKCVYRQPQSMAIAKTVKDKKPEPTGFCSDPNAVCSCKPGFTVNADKTKCLEVDECKTNNGGCDSKRTCTNTIGSMTCGDCPAGYANDGAKGCKGGWAPKSNAQLKGAIVECLKLSPTDCSKGPHGPIGSWDVSAVTDMSKLFVDATWSINAVPGADKFDGDISKWDVSRVTRMNHMFYKATSFNGDVSKWDVSRVITMNHMFYHATSFDGDISKWDVSKVTDMNSMFYQAYSFNGDISKWDVSKVTNMYAMFASASSFNGDISKWDVSRVTNMRFMFQSASKFNGDISKWDVSKVTNMFAMFRHASSFNGDLSKWDVSKVTNMQAMFHYASSFNADISKWDVSRVTAMHSMFSQTAKFAQTLCGAWKASTADKGWMFYGSSGKMC